MKLKLLLLRLEMIWRQTQEEFLGVAGSAAPVTPFVVKDPWSICSQTPRASPFLARPRCLSAGLR